MPEKKAELLEKSKKVIMENIDDDVSISDTTINIKVTEEERDLIRRIKRYYRIHNMSVGGDLKDLLTVHTAQLIEKGFCDLSDSSNSLLGSDPIQAES